MQGYTLDYQVAPYNEASRVKIVGISTVSAHKKCASVPIVYQTMQDLCRLTPEMACFQAFAGFFSARIRTIVNKG